MMVEIKVQVASPQTKLAGMSTLWSNGHGYKKNFNLNVIMLLKVQCSSLRTQISYLLTLSFGILV